MGGLRAVGVLLSGLFGPLFSFGVERPPGLGWRISLSIISFFGSIIAVILWLFFYAGEFNAYQNIAVIAVIVLAFFALMGATWASFGMRYGGWSQRGGIRN